MGKLCILLCIMHAVLLLCAVDALRMHSELFAFKCIACHAVEDQLETEPHAHRECYGLLACRMTASDTSITCQLNQP